MAVTINDVAKAAKVSPSTVSRVVANNPRISEKTRERVIKVMEEMDYHPNIIARSLANRSTNIIGVMIPSTTEKAFKHPFFPEVLRGITSKAYENKYKVLISSADSIEEEKEVIRELVNGSIVEGIILLTSRIKDPSIAELRKLDLPFVVVGRPEDAYENEINWVDNDNFNAGYNLTKHMIDQGLKQIAFIGVSPQYIVTLDRLEGYKKALEDNKIEIIDDLIVDGKFMGDTGDNLMQSLIDRGYKPDGVIASDDFLAFEIIKLLTEMGVNVPYDIAVAGFNNSEIAGFFNPSLTSVEVNAYSLGVKAMDILSTSIRSDYKCINRSIVPTKIIVRKSTSRI